MDDPAQVERWGLWVEAATMVLGRAKPMDAVLDDGPSSRWVTGCNPRAHALHPRSGSSRPRARLAPTPENLPTGRVL